MKQISSEENAIIMSSNGTFIDNRMNDLNYRLFKKYICNFTWTRKSGYDLNRGNIMITWYALFTIIVFYKTKVGPLRSRLCERKLYFNRYKWFGNCQPANGKYKLYRVSYTIFVTNIIVVAENYLHFVLIFLFECAARVLEIVSS